MIKIMPNDFFCRLEDIPCRRVALARGALVFQRGDRVRDFYRVLDGEVHLLRRQPDGAAFILQRAHAGDVLAEASVGTPVFHCGAEAVTRAQLAVWPAARVRRLIETDQGAAAGYSRHLARQLRAARMRAEILSLRRVAERLDAWLAWHDGVLPETGQMAALARDLNVSAEALYREMARRRKRQARPGGQRKRHEETAMRKQA